MTNLIACLSTGKGTWGHVSRLIGDEKWEKVFLITNEFGKENFNIESENTEFIVVDQNKGLMDLRDEVLENLKDKIKGELAINFVSGTGKEHMAIVGALLKLGVGIRLIALTKDGVKEI